MINRNFPKYFHLLLEYSEKEMKTIITKNEKLIKKIILDYQKNLSILKKMRGRRLFCSRNHCFLCEVLSKYSEYDKETINHLLVQRVFYSPNMIEELKISSINVLNS
jgi:hypothetical protein